MVPSIVLRSVALTAISVLVMTSPAGGAIREGQPRERTRDARGISRSPERAPESGPVEANAEQEAKAEEKSPRRWSMAGIWAMMHPQRPGVVQFREDGSFSAVDGKGGRWTLSSDRDGLLLVLLWSDGATDAASMINADQFSGKTPEGSFTLRRRGGTPAGTQIEEPNGPIEITSAMFGSGDNRADVTMELRKLVKDGRLHIPAPWNFGSVDPKKAESEDLIIQYRIGDRNRTARFRKNEPIILPKE